MPRAVRSQGRPDTAVFPVDWESSHAAVVAKTLTATIAWYAPKTSAEAPVMNDDFTFTPDADATPVHEGGARIQVLNGQEANVLTGDQKVVTVDYLVVIDKDSPEIPLGAIGKVTACTDPELVGARRLVVRKIARGSVRWERDLWCVDSLTHTP